MNKAQLTPSPASTYNRARVYVSAKGVVEPRLAVAS